jgi:hypothetical protein
MVWSPPGTVKDKGGAPRDGAVPLIRRRSAGFGSTADGKGAGPAVGGKTKSIRGVAQFQKATFWRTAME